MKKNYIKGIIICFLLIFLTLISTNKLSIKNFFQATYGTKMIQQIKTKMSNHVNSSLYSSNAILMSVHNGKIIMEKNSDDPIYPASLTKIMTAIVAIEHIPDLSQQIELPPDIFQNLYSANASMAGFLPNEKVKAIDLLYGTLLPSGAEATIGLAQHISGSEDEFVKQMNKKAKQLGMKHTHFTNATGLQETNHYTSVKDISILLRHALKNKIFREIFTTKRYSTSSTNLHPEGITFSSSMFLKMESPEISGGEIIGGKTGYTEEAGLCLASLAIKEGEEFIFVTAGAKGNHKTKQFHIEDAFTVYNNI